MTLDLADAADLTISTANGNIAINVDIAGTSEGVATDVVLNAGTGTVSIEGISSDINDVTLTGNGITLNDDITLTAFTPSGEGAVEDKGDFKATGPVELATTNIDINTSSGSGGTVTRCYIYR